MNSRLTTRHGQGKEICDRLRAELGIPSRALSFQVTFEPTGLIKVSCEYLPEELAEVDPFQFNPRKRFTNLNEAQEKMQPQQVPESKP